MEITSVRKSLIFDGVERSCHAISLDFRFASAGIVCLHDFDKDFWF